MSPAIDYSANVPFQHRHVGRVYGSLCCDTTRPLWRCRSLWPPATLMVVRFAKMPDRGIERRGIEKPASAQDPQQDRYPSDREGRHEKGRAGAAQALRNARNAASLPAVAQTFGDFRETSPEFRCPRIQPRPGR